MATETSVTIIEASEALSVAVAGWLTAILDASEGSNENAARVALHAWRQMLEGRYDLRVVCTLRRGTISLEAYDDTHFTTVWTLEVPPLRPADGFGETPLTRQ
jgi:hypothetical protein